MNNLIDRDEQLYLMHFWMKNTDINVQNAIETNNLNKLELLFAYHLHYEFGIEEYNDIAKQMITDFYIF